MTDSEFDAAVVAAVLAEAGLRGWRGTRLVEDDIVPPASVPPHDPPIDPVI